MIKIPERFEKRGGEARQNDGVGQRQKVWSVKHLLWIGI